MCDDLYSFARLKYDAGLYADAAEYLESYIALKEDKDSIVDAYWGALASEILVGNLNRAFKYVEVLKEVIDANKVKRKPLQQVQMRVWLMHWSLFVFFSSVDGV